LLYHLVPFQCGQPFPRPVLRGRGDPAWRPPPPGRGGTA
jgi:hypothetical protein